MNLKKFLYYVPFYVPFIMLHHITAKLDDIHRIETLMESSISTLLGELLNKQQLEASIFCFWEHVQINCKATHDVGRHV